MRHLLKSFSILALLFLVHCPTAAYTIDAAGTARFRAATKAAMCGPEKKGLMLPGRHTFNIKKASIIPNEDGKRLWINGQISHHLSFRPDDQVYYTIEVQNGMPMTPSIRTNRGGWGAMLSPLVTLVNTLIALETGKGTPITPEAIQKSSAELAALVGGDWESQSKIVVALVSMAATNPNYCSM